MTEQRFVYYQDLAKARIAVKKRLRAKGVAYDPEAPLEELEALL